MKYPFPVFILLSVIIAGCKQNHSERKITGDQVVTWERWVAETIRRDIFSPPQVARIFSYSQIAAYEALLPAFPGNKSFAGKLNGLSKLPELKDKNHFDPELAALTAYLKTARIFLYNEKAVDAYYKQWSDSLIKIIGDETTVNNSIAFGDSIAAAMKRWQGKDKFKETRTYTRYNLIKQDYAWKPTPPNFEQAFEPYWGTIRPFVVDSNEIPDGLIFASFAKDSTSDFYKAAYEVYSIGKAKSDSLQQIAWYWDDNPNTTINSGHLMFKVQKHSPPSHWMLIAAQTTQEKKFDAVKTAYTLAVTGMSMHDALVYCWKAKYKYNLIRPVSYITQYIDPYWEPLIQTPPFPETPSGHSTLSRAAAVVLTDLVGDNYTFTDTTEKQFDLGVRQFSSFIAAAEEAKMSRLYGGIHYRFGNETGAVLGDTIGNLICKKLEL